MSEHTETTVQDKDLAQLEGKQIKPYDFKHPKLVSKEIMGVLRKIHDMYARNIKRIFANILNIKAEVTLRDIEQVVFAEYLNEIEPPTALFLFNIEELGDWAVMQMEPGFCINFVERQSGGRSKDVESPRALTRIEERIMSRTVDKMVKELCHVWSSYLNMTIINHVYESKPANVRTISSHVPGIKVIFDVKLDELHAPLTLCYPYALLKEQMVNSVNQFEKSDTKEVMSPTMKRRFKEDLKESSVTLRAILGQQTISLRDLVQLTEGEMIKLNQPIHKPLKIMINNAPKMAGFPGKMNGKRAIKIFQVNKS